MPIKVGIVGASGYWGRKVLRALLDLSYVEVGACAGHSDWNRLIDVVQSSYSDYPPTSLPKTTLNYHDVIQRPELDAIIIATPAETHFSLASEALRAGKHVFVEKPVCLGLAEAQDLAQLARASGRLLFIDHTYLHSECIHFIKGKIDGGELGAKIHYFHSNRTQMGIYRSHSVLWDLGPHDLSIVKYLFSNEVLDSTFGCGHSSFGALEHDTEEAVQDTAFFKLSFKSGFSASAYLSWCHPKRSRDIVIAGEQMMILFENNSRVSLFEHNLSSRTSQQAMDWHLVEEHVFDDDPLKNSLRCFAESLLKEEQPTLPRGASPAFACEIVEILERIERSMKA